MSFPVQRPPVTIVVLSKYIDVFTPFLASLRRFKTLNDITIVVDSDTPEKWQGIQGHDIGLTMLIKGHEKFSMAGNGNLGLKSVPKDHDILYCGDDVRFLEPTTIERLQEIAYSDPKIGILSPRILGRGSKAQVECKKLSEVPPLQMWFPCIYIKRELIDKIGYLDEQFNDFGCDDFDYCVRTLQAGYKLAVTPHVTVQHEYSPEGGPTTFVKAIGADKWRAQEQHAQQKVCQKYGITYQEFLKLANGDLSVLNKDPKAPKEIKNVMEVTDDPYTGIACKQEDAREFLRTRSLFVATPVYGGNSMTVNFVNSLMGLQNVCKDLGMGFQVHFMYNESLITRARNAMVREFQKTEHTHMLFIDCDISFNPNDIILMILQKEEIIGAPCARKSLRWDRIISYITKNAGKNPRTGNWITGEELQKITGQYVVNFMPTDVTRTHIDLGKLTEVRHVGTGIMMIKRAVFDKITEAFPNKWYLQAADEEGGRQPCYMYFQAEINEDSREENPGGYPNYESEDYGFCTLAKKAGVRIWLAPWLVTEHMGTYLYHGDLKSVADSGGGLR